LRSTSLLGMSTCPISRHSVASLIFVDRICCRSKSCRTLFAGRVLPDRWSCGQALRNLDAKVGRYLPAIDSLLTATALDHNSAAPLLTAAPAQPSLAAGFAQPVSRLWFCPRGWCPRPAT
jgi:hypothetical protein